MPVKMEKYEITLNGDDAVATAEVVVTDDAGKEIGRKAISAYVNAALRADDPKARADLGKAARPDAKTVLKQKMLAEAEAAVAEVKATTAPLEHFAGLDTELATEVGKLSANTGTVPKEVA